MHTRATCDSAGSDLCGLESAETQRSIRGCVTQLGGRGSNFLSPETYQRAFRGHIIQIIWLILKQVTRIYSTSLTEVATSLLEFTYYMGSHSVTCHPAEVRFQPLRQPKLVLDLATPGGCKAEFAYWLVTYRDGIPAQRRSPIHVLSGPSVGKTSLN